MARTTKSIVPHGTLTEQDRQLADALFANGPAAMLEAGKSLDDCAEFLKRPEVKHYIGSLLGEMRNQEEQDARRRFVLKRRVAGMATDALRVIRDSIRGPIYARMPTGAVMADGFGNPIVETPEPTRNQSSTARYVLETLGLLPDADAGAVTGDLASLVAASLPPPPPPPLDYEADEQTDQQRALARERRRAVIEAMVRQLPKLRAEAQKALNKTVRRRRAVKASRDDAPPTET